MLPNPWYELASSLAHPLQYRWAQPRLFYLKRYLRWQRRTREQRAAIDGPEKLTVIVMNYLRPRNLEPMVWGLLRADFVGKIIVSNNNPKYRIADWVRLRDERLHLVDQPRQRFSSIRFEIAKSEPGPYFACIDDDVFLEPDQLARVFRELIAHPQAPHGIQGERYLGEGAPRTFRGWMVNLHGREGRPDAINTCYLFTRDHVLEMERLVDRLGLELGNIPVGSDIVLSSSGTEKPYLHGVGPLSHCLSSHRFGVATWTKQGFFSRRAELFRSLCALKGWPVAEASAGPLAPAVFAQASPAG